MRTNKLISKMQVAFVLMASSGFLLAECPDTVRTKTSDNSCSGTGSCTYYEDSDYTMCKSQSGSGTSCDQNNSTGYVTRTWYTGHCSGGTCVSDSSRSDSVWVTWRETNTACPQG